MKKKLSFCHEHKFSNLYIFATQCRRPQIFKILKIHEIFCENPRIIFVLFYDVHKENMFTINLEDGFQTFLWHFWQFSLRNLIVLFPSNDQKVLKDISLKDTGGGLEGSHWGLVEIPFPYVSYSLHCRMNDSTQLQQIQQNNPPPVDLHIKKAI